MTCLRYMTMFLVFSVMSITPAAVPAHAELVNGDEVQEHNEKVCYSVLLESCGSHKLQVIKALRKIRHDLGLIETKKLVEDAPINIATDVSQAEAYEMKRLLEEAGATVTLL